MSPVFNPRTWEGEAGGSGVDEGHSKVLSEPKLVYIRGGGKQRGEGRREGKKRGDNSLMLSRPLLSPLLFIT